MKCDNCKFNFIEPPDSYPYPIQYCGKFHWEGAGEDGMDYDGPDYWADCKDFEDKGGKINE